METSLRLACIFAIFGAAHHERADEHIRSTIAAIYCRRSPIGGPATSWRAPKRTWQIAANPKADGRDGGGVRIALA